MTLRVQGGEEDKAISDEKLVIGHLRKGLKEHTVKSTGITLAAQSIKVALQLISIVVLSRLLEPGDFGLVAMATVFTGLAKTFMEGGLSMATIQREQISQSQVSNLFWINSGLGIVVCIIVVSLAPLIAWVYGESRLLDVVYALSLSFFIGGLSIQHDALLRRQMRFKAIAIIDVVSMATGIFMAIWLAHSGYGYWSLVMMPIIMMTIQTCLRWGMAGWKPNNITRHTDTKSLVNFGMQLTGANFVGYFTTNITPFVVGFIGGASSLGLYNRAFAIASIPSKQALPPIMNVMQSALARISGEPERLKLTTLSLMKKIALFTMFITVCMVTMADWLIAILLGPSWEQAVPIFAILALSSIVTPITTFTAITLIALGEAKALMKWKMIAFVMLLGFLSVGSIWGVIGVVLAHGLSGFFIRMPLFLFYASQYQPIKFSDYMRSLLPSLLCAFGTGIVVIVIRQVYEPESEYLAIALFTLLATIIYFAFVLTIKTLRVELFDTLELVKMLFSRRLKKQHS